MAFTAVWPAPLARVALEPFLTAWSAPLEFLRGRFDGGCVASVDVLALRCFLSRLGTAESSASSADASRDDGCWSSAVGVCMAAVDAAAVDADAADADGFRFLLALSELEGEGDDMVERLSGREHWKGDDDTG